MFYILQQFEKHQKQTSLCFIFIYFIIIGLKTEKKH